MPYNRHYGGFFGWNPGRPAPGQVIPVVGPPQEYVPPHFADAIIGLQQFIAEHPYQNQANLPEAQQELIAPPLEDEQGNMINGFRIGCDPEFMLLDKQGRTVAASMYFNANGEIGYDHGGRVAEFRPGPSKGVLPIVRKIQDLVKSDLVVKAGCRLRAGAICNHDCLGGHVHFGFNAFTEKPQYPHISCLQGGLLNDRGAQVTKALDALTKVLEHLDILPKDESVKRRNSAQGENNLYGAYGDVRDCHGHMEYRTMASWLFDPKVAFLCLTAAKLAAADPTGSYEALKDCKSFETFSNWLDQYKTKDLNATRASEKIIEKGLKRIQVDPEIDFRERWESLGI